MSSLRVALRVIGRSIRWTLLAIPVAALGAWLIVRSHEPVLYGLDRLDLTACSFFGLSLLGAPMFGSIGLVLGLRAELRHPGDATGETPVHTADQGCSNTSAS